MTAVSSLTLDHFNKVIHVDVPLLQWDGAALL
jgi:hypothetical protein